MNLWYNVAKEKIGDESKKHEPTIFSMKQKLQTLKDDINQNADLQRVETQVKEKLSQLQVQTQQFGQQVISTQDEKRHNLKEFLDEEEKEEVKVEATGGEANQEVVGEETQAVADDTKQSSAFKIDADEDDDGATEEDGKEKDGEANTDDVIASEEFADEDDDEEVAVKDDEQKEEEEAKIEPEEEVKSEAEVKEVQSSPEDGDDPDFVKAELQVNKVHMTVYEDNLKKGKEVLLEDYLCQPARKEIKRPNFFKSVSKKCNKI